MMIRLPTPIVSNTLEIGKYLPPLIGIRSVIFGVGEASISDGGAGLGGERGFGVDVGTSVGRGGHVAVLFTGVGRDGGVDPIVGRVGSVGATVGREGRVGVGS
jgi:hypothetical protein